MVSFSKKVLGLAGTAMTFAGMAFGQAACATPTAQTNIIRAEGTTEQVAALTFVCTAPVASPAGQATVQVFLSPSLPVTSKVLNNTPTTEALLQVNGAAPGTNAAGAAGSVQGAVNGSTITFSGVQLPALGVGGTFTFTISNVRVNASSLSVGTGVPPNISETVFVSGSTGVIAPAALSATQVAFAQNGLGTTTLRNSFTNGAGGFPTGTGGNSGSNNFSVCVAYSPRIDAVNLSAAAAVSGRSLAFAVRVNENFAAAFKAVGAYGANGVAGTANTEQSQIAVASGSGNQVFQATRFQVTFTNIPTGVTLYVPNGLIGSNIAGSTTTAQYTASGVNTLFAASNGGTSNSVQGGSTGFGSGSANGLIAVPASGTAVFEIQAADLNFVDRFDIPVYAVTTANTVAGTSTGIGVAVSFNPIGSTSVPNFVVGPNTSTISASTFNICSTSLLFPFVTNQIGFDTGIAISNTSSDPFGTNGASAQAGTCTLNFYGTGAPTPANLATASIASGTTYTQVLSGVAAGFQGYMIAQCNFQFAHGFAFITNGVGANGGLSQGYLAGVIPDVNQGARSASDPSKALVGAGETLGN